MPYVKQNLDALNAYLPAGAYEIILPYLHQYCIQLKITQSRKSLLGQFQHDSRNGRNSISINGDLEPYNFLLTLSHEIAHCICFNTYGSKVAPHGKEWQYINGVLLNQLLAQNIFPEDIKQVLVKSIYTQRASCTDHELETVLLKYDTKKQHLTTVASLSIGSVFAIDQGKQFTILEKRRTRYLCQEVGSTKQVLFPASYKVQSVEK